MAEGAVAALAVGTAFDVFGSINEAKAQEDAAKADANAKRLQAQELLRRSEFNIDQLEAETERFRSSQVGAAAAGGIDVGSGATLIQLEQLNRDLQEEVAAQREEAEFRAAALNAGADVSLSLAGDIRRAGRLGAVASGLQGIGRIAGR